MAFSITPADVLEHADVGGHPLVLGPEHPGHHVPRGQAANNALSADLGRLFTLYTQAGYDYGLVENVMIRMESALVDLLKVSPWAMLAMRTRGPLAMYDPNDRLDLGYVMRRPFRRLVLLPHSPGGFWRVSVQLQLGDRYDDHSTRMRVRCLLRGMPGHDEGDIFSWYEPDPDPVVRGRCRLIEQFARQRLTG